MELTLRWQEPMTFTGKTPTGATITLDSHPESGGTGNGPTPVEAMVAAAAACSGMDVVAVLKKKRQPVDGYEVTAIEERGPAGEYPRPLLRLKVLHRIWGEGLDPAAVARAVELSDQKYCTVLATLRQTVEVESDWEVADTTA
ncbi:MAG: OsmC family protein [Fimbriimonadaceae bacterium]|nr:OsmC family protein [Fimbriimonadaceae bacterium]